MQETERKKGFFFIKENVFIYFIGVKNDTFDSIFKVIKSTLYILFIFRGI